MSRQRQRQRWRLRPLLTTSQRRQQLPKGSSMPSGSLETLSSVCVNGIPPWTVGNGWAGGMKLRFFSDQRQQTKLKSEILFTFKNVFLMKSTQRRHFNGRASASVPEMMVGPYKQSGIYRTPAAGSLTRSQLYIHMHERTYKLHYIFNV